jgi:hypothetical protein
MQAAVSTDRAHPESGAPSAKEALFAGASAVVVSALYVAVAAWHGALGVARGDDWVYYRAAFKLARSGSFSADPWAFTMLVGHLLLAQPVIAVFGSSLTALQLMVALLGAVAMTATYLVLRSFLSNGRAAFAVGCLALGPIYGTLSVSYMTDVPAFTLEALVLLTGLQALRTSRFSFPWFVVSLLMGIAAFSIREYALAAPAAVSIVALRRVGSYDRLKLRRVAVSVSVGLLVAASMYVWRHSLPGASHVVRPLQSPLVSAAYVCSAAFTISLFVFPIMFLISVRGVTRVLQDHPRVVLLVAGPVVLIWASLSANGAVLVGNYLTPHGSDPETLPGQPPVVVPPVLWQVLLILSLLSLLTLAGLGLARHHTPHDTRTPVTRSMAQSTGMQLSWVFCLVMFTGLAVVKIATPGVIADRYLIPIVPFVLAVALDRAADDGLLVRRFGPVAVASLATMAVLGTAVVDAAATFDGAKWQLATSVQRSGFPAESIDGGYEWFGYHQPGKIVDFRLNTPARNWWDRLFENQAICVETRHAATPPWAGARAVDGVVGRLTVRTLFGVKYDLVAVRTTEPCLAPRAALVTSR